MKEFFITSETWIDLPPNLRSRNKIKLFRLHQKSKNSSIRVSSWSHRRKNLLPEFDGCLSPRQWPDLYLKLRCSEDVPEKKNSLEKLRNNINTRGHLQVDPRHCRTFQICRRKFHPIETPWGRGNLDKLTKELIEFYLNSMIFLIANINEAHRVGGDAPWVVKFAIGCSLTSKSPEKSSWKLWNYLRSFESFLKILPAGSKTWIRWL